MAGQAASRRELLTRFEGFFAREGLDLAEITPEVVETATLIVLNECMPVGMAS